MYKRGITLGFVIGWGNLNGIVDSNIYRAADKPLYRLGHGVVLAYLTLFLLGGSVMTHLMLRNENRKRRAGKRDATIEGKSEEEIDLMGDKRSGCSVYFGFGLSIADFSQAGFHLHALRLRFLVEECKSG